MSKVDLFAAYAAGRGFQREPVRGVHEALRMRAADGTWLIFHQRQGAQHLTVPEGAASALVRDFLKARKETAT